MKRDGYKDATIEMSHKILSLLKRRGASLADSESVKQVISLQTWGGNRRRNVINAYTQYLKYYGYSWTEPKNTVIRKIPFIPSEDEIDQIIAASSNALACFLQLLKETAMRAGEALALRWIDVDCERRVICCNNPEKNSNSRSFPNISIKLLTMLGNLPHTSEYVFYNRTFYSLKNQLMRARRKTSEKLANPRLKEIHFHTLRHWKATMLYHYTKDLIYVQTFLGYRSIENTMLYIQLDKALFAGMKDDTFVVRAVSSVEEAIALGEVGFEPYLLFDGVQLMRKRK
jgi:integrase